MQKLTTKLIGVRITSKCTLKCKLCSERMPYYSAPKDYPLTQIKKEWGAVFQIYQYIENVDISGGEPLLYKDLPEILVELEKYKDSFGCVRIVTNGTLILSEPMLKTIKRLSYPFMLLIDDYGEYSKNIGSLQSQCIENQIKFRTNCYHGPKQHCDGWVDFGDFSDRAYTFDQVKKIYDNCHLAHYMCLTMLDGKLFPCAWSASAYECSDVEPVIIPEDDYIDLMNSDPVEEKINKAMLFGKKLHTACYHCNGFDSQNAKRFPAAEQLD